MTATAFTIFKLPGNRNRQIPEGSGRKEGAPISIFGSAIEKKKPQRAGRGTGFLGISKRLAECHPSVKTPRGS